MKMKEFGPPGGARVPGAPLGSANDYEVWSIPGNLTNFVLSHDSLNSAKVI